ncbi:Uncharacterised protein [Mycobacteroides abscessus subsp. abscessus]|nr:Uncharacterised protein [Mycobacteroides abscessus subsp. abscessus]
MSRATGLSGSAPGAASRLRPSAGPRDSVVSRSRWRSSMPSISFCTSSGVRWARGPVRCSAFHGRAEARCAPAVSESATPQNTARRRRSSMRRVISADSARSDSAFTSVSASTSAGTRATPGPVESAMNCSITASVSRSSSSPTSAIDAAASAR